MKIDEIGKKQCINIGSFKSKEEAIMARKQKEIELFGEYRRKI